jgi:hypothetical protein
MRAPATGVRVELSALPLIQTGAAKQEPTAKHAAIADNLRPIPDS